MPAERAMIRTGGTRQAVEVATSSGIPSPDHHVSAVFERESVKLLGYFIRRVRDREDAADLVAETALILWRRASDVPLDPERARMWLYGVARKVLSGHRRGNVRRTALADRLRSELSSVEGVDQRVEDVREAVLALPHREQELVAFVHWEGFTIAEAAAIIGIRPGTARMRYTRARQRLRASLS